MHVEQVVWDMDGTLLDSGRAVPAALVAAVRQLGGKAVIPDEVVANYWRGTPEVILEWLVGRNLSAEECDVYYQQLQQVRVAAYPQVADTLATLRRRGRAVAVFTGASRPAARILLAAAGLQVDVVIGGEQVLPKPAPDGLLLAGKLLKTHPSRMAYVGDSPLDLRAATGAGCFAVAAGWGHMHDPAEPADRTLAVPGDVLAMLPADVDAG